eukprot:scaffold569_cov408-Prasinococcus_capsulatus_cf.AAC.29
MVVAMKTPKDDVSSAVLPIAIWNRFQRIFGIVWGREEDYSHECLHAHKTQSFAQSISSTALMHVEVPVWQLRGYTRALELLRARTLPLPAQVKLVERHPRFLREVSQIHKEVPNPSPLRIKPGHYWRSSSNSP